MAENTSSQTPLKSPASIINCGAPASGEREFLKVNIIMILKAVNLLKQSVKFHTLQSILHPHGRQENFRTFGTFGRILKED